MAAVGDALENWLSSYDSEFKHSRDPASRPLPQVFYKLPVLVDDTISKIEQLTQHVPLWTKPIPSVRRVRSQEQLESAIKYLEQQQLITINLHGRRIDRDHDPAFITITAYESPEKVLCFVFDYSKPTAQRLRHIIMSTKSRKLVAEVEIISDVLFNRIYPEDIWDAEKHSVVDICLLHLDTRRLAHILDSADVSKIHRSPPPAYKRTNIIIQELVYGCGLDAIHFPLLFSGENELKDSEYKLLELETYNTATYNYVARTSVIFLNLHNKLIQERQSFAFKKVVTSIERVLNTGDEKWRGMSLQRHSHVPMYHPSEILKEQAMIRTVPTWPSPPFELVWVDESNLRATISHLNSFPSQGICAINLYGRFIDRFTDPAFIALATLDPSTSAIKVFMIKFTFKEAVEAIWPFIMRKDTYKIVPVVEYIFDCLFLNVFKAKGKVWSAHTHKIVSLQHWDKLANELEAYSKSLPAKRGRMDLEQMIVHNLKLEITSEHFPFLGDLETNESYLLHLKPKKYPAIRNFVARTVTAMFFVHKSIIKRLNSPFTEQSSLFIKLVVQKPTALAAQQMSKRLRSWAPCNKKSLYELSDEEEAVARIDQVLGGTKA